MIKRTLLFAIIWQITFSALALASSSSGLNTEFIPASRNLGIGTLTPNTKLDINGEIMIRGGSPAAGKILSSDKNGKAAWVSVSLGADADTINSLDSNQLLRSDNSDHFRSGVLSTDASTRFDINGDLSIADTDISLDAANTSFTQSSGNISFNPASGKDLTTTINGGGEFKINTNDFVFNGTNARVGIGFTNPSTKLDVNGTITSSTINGTNANFTNLIISSLNITNAMNFSKLIATNNVNGSIANFNTGNFTNLVVSGTINGTSFDGDFINGSILFANNQGVISQDSSHLYWDRGNNQLAVGGNTTVYPLTVNGVVSIKESSAPSGTTGFAKLYTNASDHKLYFVDQSGTSYNLINGSSAAMTDATTLDGLDSSQFLRADANTTYATGIFNVMGANTLDINSTNVSIADIDITLDGGSTTFTQTTGNLAFIPASGKDLSSTITGGGEFLINSMDLVFNGTNARTGIGFKAPRVKLDVNGTILATTINGTSANFTNITAGSITNSGTTNFNKLLVTNNVNGSIANFSNGNFTNIIAGTINGTTSSFDGDFTNGSVLFSNASGVISQNNNHFFWDRTNKRLALNHKQPDMTIDVNGAVTIRNINDGTISSPGSTVTYRTFTYVNKANGYSMTANKPSGTVNGDLLIAFEDSMGASDSHNTPAGWTLIKTSDKLHGFVSTWDIHMSAWYKIASNEPSSYTFTGTANVGRDLHIVRYDGHHPSNPINASAITNGVTASSIANTTSVTTSVANTKIIKLMGVGGSPLQGYGNLASGYTQRVRGSMDSLFLDKDQAAIGTTDTNTIEYVDDGIGYGGMRYAGITFAIAPAPGISSSILPDPDNGSMFLYISNGAASDANPGDLYAKIKEAGTAKTIKIIDFNNGRLMNFSSTDKLQGIDSTQFLRSDASDTYSSGTLTLNASTSLAIDASATVDIDSSNLSIADTNINLDGASTTFTQSTGAISFVPASANDLTATINSGGEFKINTNDLVFNGANARVGIGTVNPSTKLEVNGTIKGLTINGTTANWTNTNVNKLIATGSVNGTNANFINANFNTANTGKLISSGVVNGTTANFTNSNFSSLNYTNLTINTLNTSTINNSGAINSAKLISSGLVNGTTANLTKVIASGSVNGLDANFNNINISGTVNGTTTSFDTDFTNGSILFANNAGIISQNNSQLYWDRINKNLAIGSNNPNEKLTVNGVFSLKGSSTPSATSGFGKLYINSSNLRPYFLDDSGNAYSILNGSLASSNPGGSNSYFQFNDSGLLAGNGALSFIKASRILRIAATAPLDINSTNLSIADNNISFDSPSGVTFTPSSGQNLNIVLSGAGDFAVNTNQLYLDSSTGQLGLNTNSPNEVLTIYGNLSLKEGSAPSASTDYGKLYVKSSDSKLYFKDDSGTEYNISDAGANVSIDGLTDGIANSTSIYLGNGSGLTSSGSYNTASGLNSLPNSSGNNNTAMGYRALSNNSTGSNNSAFGLDALYTNTSGQNNTAFGSSALRYNSTGSFNTAFGVNALVNNISGIRNNAIGHQTLSANTNGDYNNAIGQESLTANISGNGNIAVGYQTLRANPGNYNTAIGFHAQYFTPFESYNTSFGSDSLGALLRGTSNTALGSGALGSMDNGSYNVAVGYLAGVKGGAYSGYSSNGIYLGYKAGAYDTADNNIYIGYNAGNGSNTGSNNIVIGYKNNSAPSPTGSNQLDIADTIYGDIANHNVGIGTASIDTKLEVNGTSMINTLVNKAFYSNSSGANVTIDWNNGNKQQITLDQNATFSFTAPSIGVGSFTLMLIQDGSGSHSVTWPVSVMWPAGSAPSLSTNANSIDLVTCLYDGTNYYCQIGLKFG